MIRRGRQAGRESIFPLVSVCFAYNRREKGAAATLASLKQQDYPHLGDHSGRVWKRAIRPRQIRSNDDDSVQRTRTFAGSDVRSSRSAREEMRRSVEAKGEYLFFVDDHTLLLPPNALSVFVQVAQRVGRRHSDFGNQLFSRILQRIVARPPRALPPSVSRRRCRYRGFRQLLRQHQCPCATRRIRAIGGFSDEAVSTLDDWELLSKAALMGLRIETMPEVFVWHREDQDQESMVHSLVNAVRSARPYTSTRAQGGAFMEQTLPRWCNSAKG